MRALRIGFVAAVLSLSQLTISSGPAQAEEDVPDAPISGTVLSASGVPVAGATIEAISSAGSVASVLTSVTGAYRIDVPPGDYTLRVTPPGGNLSGLSTIGIEAPRNWPLDFSLSQKTVGRVFLTGDVNFSNGLPATSGTVLFSGAGGPIRSTGFFSTATVPGTAGTWSVNSRGTTGAGSEVVLFASGGPRTTIQQDTYAEFIIPTTTTRVSVTDQQGNPIAGASIRMNSGGFGLPSTSVELIANSAPFTTSWTATSRTDAAGQVSLPRPSLVSASQVTLIVDPPTNRHLPHFNTTSLPTVSGELSVVLAPRVSSVTTAPPATPAPTPSATPSATPSVTPTPTPISLSGVVSLSNGRAVPGAMVIPIDPTQRVNGGNTANNLGQYVVTKPAGFTGSWQLSCRPQSLVALPDPLCFSLSGGDVVRRIADTQVDFNIPMNLYRIRVLDDRGMPISDARVQASVRDGVQSNAAIVNLLPGELPFRGTWRGFDVTGEDGWAQVPGIQMTNTPFVDIEITTDQASRHEGKSLRILASDLSDTVIVLGLKPSSISGISPTRVEPGQSFIITGTNLLGASDVRIGGAQASFTVDSNSKIIATVPSDATSGVVQVTTASGTSTFGSTVTVLPPALVITTEALESGQVGRTYNQTFGASGGTSPYRWRIQGTRPSGLTLTSQGVLQGTPLRVINAPIRVSVTDATGKSVTRSVPLNIEPKPLTLPGAISAVSGQGAAQRISLSWRQPTDDGGNPITGYRIEVSTDSGQTWQEFVSNTRSRTTGRSFAFTAGVDALFRVAAINRLGVGPFGANIVSPVLTAYGPASAPTNVTVSTGSGLIKAQWTPPTSNGGASVTGYRIRISTNGRSWSTLINNTRSTALESSFRQRTGRNYWIQVSAINAGGISPYATSSDPVYLAP